MVERATAVQAAQIGVETTAGTAVTASKRLLSVGFKQGIKVDTKAEMSQGFKLPTAVSIGKDWTEGTFDGYAGYNDLAYLLSSVLLGVTPSGAGVDKTWSFIPAVRSSDVPKTFTLELGDANTRFSRTTHNVVTDLSLSWAKENIALSGSYMGRSLTDQTGALGTATEMKAMKNYAGHRLSPWLGHLMVSRSETARPLLTPGEIMQLPPTDEIVMAAGTPPIRAKKARYYEDARFKERLLPPPALMG